MIKSICFDLDDTICFPNHGEKDTYKKYGLAKPNDQVIAQIRRLKRDLGFHIVLLSARRMLTFGGNIDKIKADVEEITRSWLNEHDVPFDELVFGKPYVTTYYVDDKAMDLKQFDTWMNSL